MRTALFSTIAALLAACPAFAQWGTIKGQVVWADAKIPAAEKAKVDKDEAHCLAKGVLEKDELVIDSKTKGVKNVMVWLAPAAAGGKVPIKPDLAAVPIKPAVIDQPMCLFEPRITMMRAGQPLVIKNSAPVAHNSRISGNPEINGTINLTIPPGGQIQKTLKAEKRPLLLACDIHGWMAGRVAVFDHPYYALTKEDGTFEIKDAPAGNFILFMNHEKAGWVHEGRTSKGQAIVIPAGGAKDLGKFKMTGEQLK